jgi:membrane protein DedA with SNARE-associated domain
MGAAVAEMSITHFLLAIFFGRIVRFVLLAILVMEFGPGVLNSLSHHFYWVLIALAVAVAAFLMGWRMRLARKRKAGRIF